MNGKRKLQLNENSKETELKKEYNKISFSVILVQPETAGNIGSIARIMKNFNFKNLVIFDPIESVDKILSHETCGFAMHGEDILFNAKILTINSQANYINELKSFLKNYDLVVATTAKGKKYTNLKRLAIFPEDFEIPISKKQLNIALLFGRESRGLTNAEISLADIILRIPTSPEYSSLKLSHGCCILLYEIFKKINSTRIGRGKKPVLLADKEDRIILYEHIKIIVKNLKIRTYKENYVYKAFKNVFERALISKKELNLILGLFSKINRIITEINPYNPYKDNTEN